MKIYLAGVEQADSIDLVKQQLIENAFISYYYAKRKSNSARIPFLRKNIKNIIVDSGAHSFFAETDSNLSASVILKQHKTKEKPECYFKKYKKWIKKYWKYFDYFVELDIGEIVGQKQVLKWRKELKKEGLFKKCIMVVHPKIVSFKDFLKMLDESKSKYIALEGDRPNRKRLPYNAWLRPAYKKRIKIHGFAMTKKEVMKKYPFASVDSTSWKAGAMYGRGQAITKNGVESIRYIDKKKCITIKQFSLKIHSKDKKENRDYRYSLSVESYKKLEQYYTLLWKARGITFK